MNDIVICPYCDNTYYFEKNIDMVTYVECPYCGTKGTVDNTDQIFELPYVGSRQYIKEHKKFPLKEVAGMAVVICIFSIALLFVNGVIDFSPEVIIREVEIIKEVPSLPEPEYMEGVGYEFTDVREPTDEELFIMEESLNLCHNPTYSEVVSFIEKDETNYYEYIENEFMCSDFSWFVMYNARQEKMRCGDVTIYPIENEWADELYEDNPAHAIVVFDTIDNGLIFVEPQFDDIFTYGEFLKMKHNNHYYAEDEWYEIEMDFDHYVIDWFYWYYDLELMQTWNLYKSEYPDFRVSYDEYFIYEEYE